MANRIPFSPQDIFGAATSDSQGVPRVLIAPHRYIQGQGTLNQLGRYIAILPSIRPAVLVSSGGLQRFGDQLEESFAGSDVNPSFKIFQGECCQNEVDRLVASLKNSGSEVDALIAVGGGKCIDTGKCVAFELDIPAVICPTIASTDAPCSAVSVMYSDDGVQVGPAFFPSNPALVVVDTSIIVNSPIRQLVAGMGDALATYYEARTCFENTAARSMVGGRPTITALAIAELSAKTILENGLSAIEAMHQKKPNDAFEQVVEANTLLSGVGFESGGLATAHAVAAGLTEISVLHQDYYHGELVGIGILTHLILEEKTNEADQAGEFMAKVGLPVHAGQLMLDIENDAAKIKSAIEAAIASHLTDSEPFKVGPENLMAAFLDANRLGNQIARSVGDDAFRQYHE